LAICDSKRIPSALRYFQNEPPPSSLAVTQLILNYLLLFRSAKRLDEHAQKWAERQLIQKGIYVAWLPNNQKSMFFNENGS
jgi:hypothetical protein